MKKKIFAAAVAFVATMSLATSAFAAAPGATNGSATTEVTVKADAPTAENAIDNNRYDDAMGYLDAIRANRINPAAYAPLQGTVSDKATAITHLKTTAHAEGIFSVWNFINRKRWNRLDDYKETFTRTICGIDMSLTPDSKLWVFPIPQNVINNNPNFTPYLN